MDLCRSKNKISLSLSTYIYIYISIYDPRVFPRDLINSYSEPTCTEFECVYLFTKSNKRHAPYLFPFDPMEMEDRMSHFLVSDLTGTLFNLTHFGSRIQSTSHTTQPEPFHFSSLPPRYTPHFSSIVSIQ